MDVGVVRAPMIRRRQTIQTITQSVSISRSRFFKSTALMWMAMWFFAGN
jgi:hypothetical protein